MQFLTTCLQCGQSIRKDATICPICGKPCDVAPLQESADGMRHGKERLTWGVLAGIWLEHAGYGLAFFSIGQILTNLELLASPRHYPYAGALTGLALLLIGSGGWMRRNLQSLPDLGISLFMTILFRYYPYGLFSLLASFALWACIINYVSFEEEATELWGRRALILLTLAIMFDATRRVMTRRL